MTTTQRRLVNDIVVQQGRGMDHFDDRSQGVVVRTTIAAGSGGEDEQRGPQTLAAAADDVLRHLADHYNIRGQVLAQNAVDRLHVIVQDALEQRDGHVVGYAAVAGRRPWRAPPGKRSHPRAVSAAAAYSTTGAPAARLGAAAADPLTRKA